mgnify:CR=1 FL=1
MAESLNFSTMQLDYWRNATHRWNIKTGATGSGKTFLDFYLLPKRIRSCTGAGLIVLIGNTKGTLQRNVIDPLRGIYGDRLIGDIGSDNTAELFGKKVYCLGADKVNQVAKIQGSTIEYAYGDEITTWSQEVFEMLKSRLRTPRSCFDGTCNPADPEHWFKEFLEGDADIYLQEYTIYDNPFLPKGFIDELCKEYAGTVYYDRQMGEGGGPGLQVLRGQGGRVPLRGRRSVRRRREAPAAVLEAGHGDRLRRQRIADDLRTVGIYGRLPRLPGAGRGRAPAY